MEPVANNPTQENPYAAAHEVGKKNVKETMDKVYDALAPLGNLSGYAEVFKREAKKNAKEVGMELWNSIKETARPVTDRINAAIDNGTNTARAIIQSSKEAGLGVAGLGEALVAFTAHEIPAFLNELDNKEYVRDAAELRRLLEKAEKGEKESGARVDSHREARKNMRGVRNRFNALVVAGTPAPRA